MRKQTSERNLMAKFTHRIHSADKWIKKHTTLYLAGIIAIIVIFAWQKRYQSTSVSHRDDSIQLKFG